MQTSVFLAKLIGPFFLAVGVGLLANAAAYRKLADEFLRSTALIYLSGLLTMPAGWRSCSPIMCGRRLARPDHAARLARADRRRRPHRDPAGHRRRSGASCWRTRQA